MFSPMLAVNIKPEQVTHDMMESPKLEGVRGVFRQGPLLTRSLKNFNNPRLQEKFQMISNLCSQHNIVLEGEFYLHGKPFKWIDSACRNANKEEAWQLQFHIFDIFIPTLAEVGFEQRYSYMKWVYGELLKLNVPDVYLIPQSKIVANGTQAEVIRSKYCDYIDQELEGIVLKRADAPYKHGRSTIKQEIFTRLKPEDPFDGVILAIIERQHNLCESEVNELGQLYKKQDKDQKAGAGIAQTAIVVSSSHSKLVRVSLTRGLKDYEETEKGPSRETLWKDRAKYIGHPIKFVGTDIKGMDAPRSPRYDVLRSDVDPIYWEHPESSSYGVVFSQSDFDVLAERDACVVEVPFSHLYNLACADM